MSSVNHTPGYWKLINMQNNSGFRITNADGAYIASTMNKYGWAGRAEQNAKLIAAAPELLEELIAANNFIKTMVNKIPASDWKDAMNAGVIKMESAIKKATT